MSPVEFSAVKEGLESGSILLIDVRSRDEIVETGKIPGSYNLPLDEMDTALKLGDAEFKEKYGFDKNAKPIITHCVMGKRAASASAKLVESGLKNVSTYEGSFKDWVLNGGRVDKTPPY